jgi:diguanylate cyclase (GGDEF)-like protein
MTTRNEEVVEAVLRAFEHLDRDGAVGELLRAAGTWCGAGKGWALIPSEDGDGWIGARSVIPGAESAWDAEGIPLPAPGEESWFHEGVKTLDGRDGGVLVPLRAVEGERPDSLLVLLDAKNLRTELLSQLAQAAIPVLRKARRIAEIRDLTIRDDTADCFNRRHFEEFILEELARSRRFRSSLSLIFFDMDNLKEVNSRLGHAMGSRTLFEVSERVRGRIRRFDKLFRFGGDEFCIVLPETEWHGAMEVAERVRDAVANQRFLTDQSAGRGGVKMTASLGVASYPLHARNKVDLIQRADRAMQRIKSASKNAIGIAKIEEGEDEHDELG